MNEEWYFETHHSESGLFTPEAVIATENKYMVIGTLDVISGAELVVKGLGDSPEEARNDANRLIGEVVVALRAAAETDRAEIARLRELCRDMYAIIKDLVDYPGELDEVVERLRETVKQMPGPPALEKAG